MSGSPPRRLVLLCGCAERGKSGVGDYSLALAAELAIRGIDARIAAVADSFVREVREEPVPWHGYPVASLRLPLNFSPEARDAAVLGWIGSFAPDWISVQFVPYAFHSKGIVTLARLPWAALAGQAKTHVMFHEVWVGDHARASLTRRMWGIIQKGAIRCIVARLRPAAVHTGIMFHRHLLQRIGVAATILPIFGNIPVTREGMDLAVKRAASPGQDWTGGFFGSIHPGFPAEHVFGLLADRAARKNQRLRVISVGNSGAGGADFDRWALRWPEIVFKDCGTLPDAALSETLADLDFGLSSTPLNIVGKSGSAAALAEHGVPVVCAALGAPTRGFQTAADHAEPRAYLLERFLALEEGRGVARPRPATVWRPSRGNSRRTSDGR